MVKVIEKRVVQEDKAPREAYFGTDPNEKMSRAKKYFEHLTE